MDKVSVFGSTGFIGSRFCSLYSNEVIPINREMRIPESNDILYLISTTTNYNVFSDLHLDINTNLNVLMDILGKITPNHVINFVSSWFVYGDTDLPARENSICKPKGFYSITKYCAEQMLVSFCETYDVRYRIFRLANVYGIGDKDVSKKKNALLYLVNEIKNGNDINLYHDGYFIRDYIHVNDVCNAMMFCMKSAPYNEIINIGNGDPLIFRDLINYVKGKLNSSSNLVKIEPPKFHS